MRKDLWYFSWWAPPQSCWSSCAFWGRQSWLFQRELQNDFWWWTEISLWSWICSQGNTSLQSLAPSFHLPIKPQRIILKQLKKWILDRRIIYYLHAFDNVSKSSIHQLFREFAKPQSLFDLLGCISFGSSMDHGQQSCDIEGSNAHVALSALPDNL